MFGKNLLSIVSALFIGSQLVSFARAACGGVSYDSTDKTCTTSCIKGFYKIFSNDETGTYTLSGTQTYTKIVKVTGSNACTDVTTDDSCANDGDVGKYYATGDGVCIVGDGTSPVTAVFADTPAVNYLIPKAKATDFEATNSQSTYDYVVLKSESNSIVFDGTYSSGEGIEDCYTTANGKIMTSIDNFCADAACDKYYTCNAGECIETVESCPRTEEEKPCVTSGSNCSGYLTTGYYYYDATDSTIGANAKTLYECEGGKACTPVPRPIGYYVNAGSSNGDVDGYIKCSRSGTEGSYTYDCGVISITSGKTSCDGTVITAGGLYRNEEVYLCLSSSATGIQLAPSTATNYMVSVTNTGFLGVSLTNGFVILNVPDNSGLATIQQYAEVNAATGDRYKYADGTENANNEIKVKGGSNTDFCTTGVISEFKRDFCKGGRTDNDKGKSIATSGDYVEYFKLIDTYDRSG